LAFASVAGALLLDVLFRQFNLPHPFAAFALSAIAITFWYGGTMPGSVAVLLSSLIRGFIFEGETSSLSRVLYELAQMYGRARESVLARQLDQRHSRWHARVGARFQIFWYRQRLRR
jgi:hypothetical protein